MRILEKLKLVQILKTREPSFIVGVVADSIWEAINDCNTDSTNCGLLVLALGMKAESKTHM